VNFKNTIVIMTSNLGSERIRERFEGIAGEDELFAASETVRLEVLELLKQRLRPEFLNRLDEIIVFKPLRRDEISGIVRIQLRHLTAMLAEQGIALDATDEAVAWLAEQGYDPQFGARPLKRLIQREVVNELSRRILAGNVQAGQRIVLDRFDGNGLVFRNAPQPAGAEA
jgi:ATP-dependent Clp protease ATP-binding subunit ClpB